MNENIYLHQMKAIPSMKHKVHTIEENKKSLDPNDDKHFLLNDCTTTLPYGGTTTLPYGHYMM